MHYFWRDTCVSSKCIIRLNEILVLIVLVKVVLKYCTSWLVVNGGSTSTNNANEIQGQQSGCYKRFPSPFEQQYGHEVAGFSKITHYLHPSLAVRIPFRPFSKALPHRSKSPPSCVPAKASKSAPFKIPHPTPSTATSSSWTANTFYGVQSYNPFLPVCWTYHPRHGESST